MSSNHHDDLAQRGSPPENGEREFGSVREAAEALNVSVSFLNKCRMEGQKRGPPYLKFGRMVRYRLADVREWGRQQSRTSTSE